MDETTRTIALVTGGSRGIGAATARGLAAAGCDVAVSYRERADEAEQVADTCRQLGVRATTVRADMASPDDVAAMFDAVDDGLGTLDVLVNNAGVVPRLGRVDSYDAERVRRLLDVNVTGLLLCCGEAVRRMSTQHGGSGGVIVNVSSRAARSGGSGEYVDYAASKAAVDTVTVGLAREVVTEGVRVVGVRPGVVETDIHEEGRLERLRDRLPMGRPAAPEEVASTIVWLATAAAAYTSGAVVDVTGAA